MEIALCDDNPRDAEQIEAYLAGYLRRQGFQATIQVFSCGEDLIAASEHQAFDIVFLDIHLGTGLNGLDIAKRLRERDEECALIFITVSREYALESYAFRAASYVVKPIQAEDMERALRQCRAIFMRNARYIEVTVDRQTIRIPLNRIQYVEIFGKDAFFYLDGETIKAHMPLDEIEARLNDASFLRCHRAFLVNMNQIAALHEQDILMRNGAVIPMCQRGRKELRLAVSRFMTAQLFGGE